MAIPLRVPNSTKRSTPAVTMAAAMVMASCHGIGYTPRSMVFPV